MIVSRLVSFYTPSTKSYVLEAKHKVKRKDEGKKYIKHQKQNMVGIRQTPKIINTVQVNSKKIMFKGKFLINF
jgi:hypothetical protein